MKKLDFKNNEVAARSEKMGPEKVNFSCVQTHFNYQCKKMVISCLVMAVLLSITILSNGQETIVPPIYNNPIIIVDATCDYCASGSIDINPYGGIGTYTYYWTGTNNQIFITQDITNLVAGTYTVTITSGMLNLTQSFVVGGPIYTDYGNITIPPGITTWTTPRAICGNVIVPNGARLNINYTDVKFTKNKGFIINEGGILKATYSTFDTNCPGYLWKGFQITHHPNLPYTQVMDPLNPDIVLLDLAIENCNVNNAIVGALCGNCTNQNTPVNSGGGASLSIQNCHFLNNMRDIYMAKCAQSNLDVSIAWNEFKIDPLAYSQPASQRINIKNMGKIIISYNTFISTYPYTNDQFLISSAVAGAMWGYFYGNNISGFGYGLNAWMSTISGPNAFYDFKGNTFHCYRDVNLDNYGSVPIKFFQSGAAPYNAFLDLQSSLIGQVHINQDLMALNDDPINFTGNCYGLRLRKCNRYIIEKAVIDLNENNEPNPALHNRLGVVIDNCGSNLSGYINNLWIGNCTVGLMYRNKNRQTSGFGGLTGAMPRCIEFENNHEDLLIMRDGSTSLGLLVGISPVIGVLESGEDKSLGMNMSLSPNPIGSANTDVRVTDEIFNYGIDHKYNFVAGEIENNTLTMVNVTTQEVPTAVFCEFLAYDPSVDWPGIAPEPWELVSLHLQKEDLRENLEQQYQALIDGGNTNLMLSQIEMTNYWQLINLFNNLMDESPNLSEAALIAAIENSVLPNSLLTQILAANPQASHSREVMSALYTQRVLTPQEEAEILAGGATYSLVEQLRFAMDAVNRTSRLLLRQAAELYFADSTITHALDSVQMIYSNQWQPEDVYYRIHLCSGIVQATALLNDWPSAYTLGTEEEEERTDMLYLLNIQNALNTGDTLLATDETELMDIMAKQHSYSSALATNLLAFSVGYKEEEDVTIAPNTGPLKSAIRQRTKLQEEVFVIYPNPAADITTLRMKRIMNVTHFVIQNTMGEMVKTISWPVGSSDVLLSLEDISAGVYTIVLYNGASQLQTLPLIKQ